jgi:hypothetical protein
MMPNRYVSRKNSVSKEDRFLALEKQIRLVVECGGDMELPLRGVSILVRTAGEQDKVLLRSATARATTPNELVFALIQKNPEYYCKTQGDDSDEDSDEDSDDEESSGKKELEFNDETKKLLEIIKDAKTSIRFSSSEFSRSVVSVWHNLLFSEKLSDVTFVCNKDGTTFHAHRVVLSGESPYFEAFFTGPWSKQNDDGRWKTEIDPSIMKAVLTFIYTGKFGTPLVGMSMDVIVMILQVGQEFQMPNLVEVCSRIIKPKLALENIKKMTSVAATISFPIAGPTNLWNHCVHFIRRNSKDVLMDTSFVALATENPDLWTNLQNEISPSRKRLHEQIAETVARAD